MSSGKKRGPKPRKVTQATRDAVMLMAAAGWTQPDIASALGMAIDTARKYLLFEMHNGKRLILAQCVRKLYQQGLEGDSAQLRFIVGHQHPEFRSRHVFENPDGSAIKLPIQVFIPDNGRGAEP